MQKTRGGWGERGRWRAGRILFFPATTPFSRSRASYFHLVWFTFAKSLTSDTLGYLGMGRTWGKFSSLPAKKHENSEPQPEKKTFNQIEEGRTSLHGKTGNSSWKVTCFAAFHLGSFRKDMGVDLRRSNFFYSF